MALAAVLDVSGPELHLFFTFHRPTIEALKALRVGAKWDRDESCWILPLTEIDRVITLLDALGYRWERSDDYRQPGGTWSDVMFDRAPTRLHAPLFRALAHVVHPDHSGDESMMRELAATWSCRDKSVPSVDLAGS